MAFSEVTLLHGAIVSALASVILLGSMAYNPRIWLQDYPKDVQARVPAKTPRERHQGQFFGALFLLVLLLGPFLSNLYLETIHGSLTFAQAFWNAFGIMFMFMWWTGS